MKQILHIDIKFPLLTGTFVYREVEALKRAGHVMTTVSIAKPNPQQVSLEAAHFLETTLYLDQICILIKLWAQIILICSCFTTWRRLFMIALREREIRGYKDRLRLLYHFILSGYLFLILKDKTFDHIHAPFLTSAATIAYFLSQYMNTPFSFTMHASNIYVNPIMLGTKLRTCKKCITISKYNKDFLLRKYGFDLENTIHIIHCGIDLDEFCCSQQEKPVPPMVLSVGQLTERKGFTYLLKAIEILKEKKLEFTCCIVGDGEDRDKLVKESSQIGLNETVTFLGRQPQEVVKKLLGKASVFTLPSIITESGGREGIPVALMEAMAMELPVVSTRTVGIPELIEHGIDGLLVEEKNPADLAEALGCLLSDAELRAEMGRSARVKVFRDFNIANTPILFDRILC